MQPRCLVGLCLALVGCSVEPLATAAPPIPTPEVYIPTATATPILPGPTPTASVTAEPTAYVCREAGGRVVEEAYSGAVLPEEIPVQVYLPPCYEQVADDYPLVVLLHGLPFAISNWVDLGVVEIVDEAIQLGDWDPFIMVMPVQPEPLFTHTDGGPGSYETELMQGLMPYVDATFRTRPDARVRAIAGISRGGVWALEIGFRHPESFRAVAALSPALVLNAARPAYDPLEIARLDAANLPPWIFLGAGEADWARPETAALADSLTAGGASPMLQIVPGDHLGPTWQALMPAMFEYLGAAWTSMAR